MSLPRQDFDYLKGIRPPKNFTSTHKQKPGPMPRQQLEDHAPRSGHVNNWCTTSGDNMLPPRTRTAIDEERGVFIANTADIVDASGDIDAADSDNDFGLNLNDEDDMGDGNDTDEVTTIEVCDNSSELRFCQTHAQSFIMANQHHQFARENGSVFYDDQLPPVPTGKNGAKAFNLRIHVHQRGEQHIMLRNKHHHPNDLLAERSFGFYDGSMQDVEIASLTSSASISSLALPHSRPFSSSVSHHEHPQILSSTPQCSSKASNNRFSSLTTSDADGFDSLSANSSFSTSATSGAGARDNVRECLEKEPPERTDDDIEVLLDFIQRLPAFANMTQSVRRALCAAMVYAAVKEVGTIVMHDGEELDSWSVLINGHVQIEYNLTDAEHHHTIHRAELHVGDSFGVIEPTMERLYHQGTMRTLCDDCQFVCVEQAKFCAILCQGKEYTSAFEKQGRTVMVIEHRLIDPASQKRGPVVIKATPQQLVEHLMADDVGSISNSQQKTADPTYADDFLLTYRIFLDSPLEISQRLMNWFNTDATLRDKVVRTVLVWINQHFVDFERYPKLMVFLEEFISALAADERTTQLRLMNIACSVKARPRMITLTRSRRDETLNFSVLGGAERGCGVFICHVGEASKALQAGLRRGDQIMKVNGISFDGITHEKALEVLRTATHLAITVQSNLFGFRDMINGPTSLAENPENLAESEDKPVLETPNGDSTRVECSEKTGEQQLSPTTLANVDFRPSPPAATLSSGSDTLNTRRKFVKAFMRMNWRSTAAKLGATPDTADFVASSSSASIISTTSSTTTNSNVCCTDALNLELPAAATSKFYTSSNSINETNDVVGSSNNVFFPSNHNADSSKTKHDNRLSLNTTTIFNKKPANGGACTVGQRLYHCLSNPDLRATLAELDKPKPNAAGVIGSTDKLNKLREEPNAVAKQPAAYCATADSFADVDHHVIKVFMPNQSFKYISITNKMTARQVILAGLHEFQLLTTNPSNLNNYSLYQVSVVAGGVTRQRRLGDTVQDLADSLPLNARYYLKNNLATPSSPANLVPDCVAHDIWKESQVEFLQLNMLEAAAQLTVQDFSVFRKIEPTEYVDELWPTNKRLPFLIKSKENKSEKLAAVAATTTAEVAVSTTTKTNLAVFTELSNRQMFWVVNEVCRHRDSPARRARVLKNFIKLAQYCFAIRNFNSCFAIVFGLGHAAISRLKATWERVPHKHVKQFRALESLMDPSRNMSKYRQLLARYQRSPPLIPFYPIVKKDLTFLNEGNTTFETIQQQQPDAGAENDLLFLVNFEKLRMFAREIRQLKHYASIAYNVDEILTSTYFADIIDNGGSAGAAAPLLRRRTRPDAAVMPTTNDGNLVSRQLLLPASKAKQLLALNLAGSFTTSVQQTKDEQQSETSDSIAATAADGSNTAKHQGSTLFSRTSATTVTSPSLKKLYENRQMMRRVKLYLSELEIEQNEEKLHALSQLCEPAAGNAATSSASAAALAADAAKTKAATLNKPEKTTNTLKLSANGSAKPAVPPKPLAAAKGPIPARDTTVSFVRCRPNNRAAAIAAGESASTLSSLPRALAQQSGHHNKNTAAVLQQNSKANHARPTQQPQPSMAVPVVGLPKFGQQSPHAVQKLLSLAEKKGARPHHLPKFPAGAVNGARFHHFNAVQSSSYYPSTTSTAFPLDVNYSVSAGNVNVNYVYGGPPPNSQRLLPALRRNFAPDNNKISSLPNNQSSVSSHLSCSSSSVVPLSPSYAAASDENAYQRYHFTPVVVQSSGSVVSSATNSSSTISGAAAAVQADLRAHPVQVTTVADHRSTRTTANAVQQQQQQQYRLSGQQQYDPLPLQRQPIRSKTQPPRPPPIEPCNTSLTSQESVPDSGFALHVSGSGSIHSTLSDFCNNRHAHRHVGAAGDVNDSSFSPSIDEGLNSCSLSDNSPGSFTRRQPKQQQQPYEAEFVHALNARERGGGGDGTLTNSNRRERTSRKAASSSNNVPGDVAQKAEPQQSMFALSRC